MRNIIVILIIIALMLLPDLYRGEFTLTNF